MLILLYSLDSSSSSVTFLAWFEWEVYWWSDLKETTRIPNLSSIPAHQEDCFWRPETAEVHGPFHTIVLLDRWKCIRFSDLAWRKLAWKYFDSIAEGYFVILPPETICNGVSFVLNLAYMLDHSNKPLRHLHWSVRNDAHKFLWDVQDSSHRLLKAQEALGSV